MLLLILTVSFVQVDSIDVHDLKLKLDQLQISVDKKEEEINDYKRTVTNLTNTVTQLQITVSSLQALVKDMSLQVKISADKNSNEEFETFRWVVSIDKVKQCEQYSKRFYVTSAPFSLQVSAAIKRDRLEIWLFRCRGKNDTVGKVFSNFTNFTCYMYLVNACGDAHIRSMNLQNDSCFNIDIVYNRSKRLGWDNFLKTSSWNDWSINNHLHLFCKVKPALI